jgi:hypothetical protein
MDIKNRNRSTVTSPSRNEETPMAGFSITGSGEDAVSQLKTQMQANQAAFDQGLSALFGVSPQPARQQQPNVPTKPAADSWGAVTSRRESGGRR